MTRSRMTNVRGYSTSTDTIDKLCKYFGCDVGDIAGYVADETVSAQSNTGKAAAQRRAGGGSASSTGKPARRTANAA